MNLDKSSVEWLLGTITGALVAVGTAVTARLLYDRWWLNRVTIRRIISSGDIDLDPLLSLHSQLFTEEVADRAEDLRRWLNEVEDMQPYNQLMLEEFLLVAKKLGKVVGYLYATYYRDSGYVFISYYGVDSSDAEARRKGAQKLMSYLGHQIEKKYPNWNGLITELELDKAPHLSRRYRQYASKLKLTGYEINIRYFQPPISPENDQRIEEVLVFIPKNEIVLIDGKYLTKPLVLSILRFIYLQIYADSFADDAEENTDYRPYRRALIDLYDSYDLTLPSVVPAHLLGQRRNRDTSPGSRG